MKSEHELARRNAREETSKRSHPDQPVQHAALRPGSQAYLQRYAGNQRTQQSPDSAADAQVSVMVEPLYRINGKPVMDRDDFIARSMQAQQEVDEAFERAGHSITAYIPSYEAAWKHVAETLEGAKLQSTRSQEALLNGLFAFVPGGVGGYVGEVLKNREMTAFVVDGGKDLVKDFLRREGKEVLINTQSSSQAFKPGANTTITWWGIATADLVEYKLLITPVISKWTERAVLRDSAFPLDFDPLVQIQTLLEKLPVLEKLRSGPQITGKTAFFIEKGMWKSWIEQYRYYLQEFKTARAGTVYAIGDRLPPSLLASSLGGYPGYKAGLIIRGRLAVVADALGEQSETWLQQWGINLLHAVEEEQAERNKGTPGQNVKDTIHRLTTWLSGSK